MKRYLSNLLILFILFSCSSNSTGEPQDCGVYEGDLFLGNQEQVNDFRNCNYSKVTGGLYITGAITSLSPLSSLTSIEGNFIIIENTIELKNLNGLNHAFSTANLRVTNNRKLESFDGFDKLQPKTVEIVDNPLLENIEGLGNVSDFIYTIYIDNCPLISNLNCFANVKTIANSLQILEIHGLTDLFGLEQVESIGTELGSGVCCGGALELVRNDNLVSLNGLGNLNTLEEGLSLLYNKSLTNIDGLSKLSNFTGEIKIDDNPLLSSISGLSLITKTANFKINSSSITNLDGLANLSHVWGDLNIFNNSKLTDFCGLQNLVSNDGVSGLYYIGNNAYNPSTAQITNGNCSR